MPGRYLQRSQVCGAWVYRVAQTELVDWEHGNGHVCASGGSNDRYCPGCSLGSGDGLLVRTELVGGVQTGDVDVTWACRKVIIKAVERRRRRYWWDEMPTYSTQFSACFPLCPSGWVLRCRRALNRRLLVRMFESTAGLFERQSSAGAADNGCGSGISIRW